MKVSQLFGISLRADAASSGVAGHDLLIRAGMVRRLAGDIWHVLPLGQLLLNTIGDCIKGQLFSIGANEMSMSLLSGLPNPSLGFVDGATEKLQTLKAKEKQYSLSSQALAEVLALINHEVNSYRQLPLIIFQERKIPTFPSHSGKGLYDPVAPLEIEAWLIAQSASALQECLDQVRIVIGNMYQMFDIPYHLVPSLPDIAGSKPSHTYLFPSQNGGITYAQTKQGTQTREMISLEFSNIDRPPLPLQKVHTPGTKTISDLADFLQIETRDTAKAVFFSTESINHPEERLVMVVIRGDLEVNESAVRRLLESSSLRPATDEEILQSGAVPGYASPIGIMRDQVIILADESVVNQRNLVAGANEANYHLLNTCYERDYEADIIGNLRLVSEEQIDSGFDKGVEMIRFREIGSDWASRQDITFMGAEGKPLPVHLGCITWNLSNILACVAEQHHDEHGLVLPKEISPFDVILVSLADGEESIQTATQLYQDFLKAGIRVLYDDRHKKTAGPGVKFTDADLRGIPIRITVAKRALKQGGVEWKLRGDDERILVPVEKVCQKVLDTCSGA